MNGRDLMCFLQDGVHPNGGLYMRGSVWVAIPLRFFLITPLDTRIGLVSGYPSKKYVRILHGEKFIAADSDINYH